MSKILVQFDGSNFYNKVKRIDKNIHLTEFDYTGLAKSVSKEKINQIIYYVGEIRKYSGNKKSQSLYASQQKLFTHLRNQKKIFTIVGKNVTMELYSICNRS